MERTLSSLSLWSVHCECNLYIPYRQFFELKGLIALNWRNEVFKIRYRGTLRTVHWTLHLSNENLVGVQLYSDTEIHKNVDKKNNKLRICRNFREFRLWTEKVIDERLFEDLYHKHLNRLLKNKEMLWFLNLYAVGASWTYLASKFYIRGVEFRKFVLL